MTASDINNLQGADRRIIQELAEVRRRAAKGPLPAFRRGVMFFDFDWNKVRIAPASGGAER